MNILQMIASTSFLTVNISIAREVGLDAAVLLSELASSQLYHEANGQLTEDGMFFETVEQIEEKTTLSKYQQAKAVAKLEEIGILKTRKKGIPAKRYFVLFPDKIMGVVDYKKLKNLTTVGQKTLPQAVKKLDCNNNRYKEKKIRIDINNIVGDSTCSEPVKEKVMEFLKYRQELGKPIKTEIGLQRMMAQIERKEQENGSTAVIECIDTSIQNQWQGIFWNKITKSTGHKEALDEAARFLQSGGSYF